MDPINGIAPTTESAKLYVVLHGELAINEEEGSEYIRVFAGYMKEHVYMAGPWLGEVHIQKGATLMLEGAANSEPPDSMDKHRDKMLLYQGGQCDPSMSYMEVVLPRPVDILTVAEATLPQAGATIYGPANTSALLPDAAATPQMGLCHVFVYDVAAGETPCFSQMSDMGAIKGLPAGSGPGWFSLHVYAEADTEVSRGHVETALRMSAAILGIDASPETVKIVGKQPDLLCPLPRTQTHLTLAQRRSGLSLLKDANLLQTHYEGLASPPDATKVFTHFDSPGSCGPSGNLVRKAK